MTLRIYRPFIAAGIIVAAFFLAFSQSSCGTYRFKDVSIPDSVKFVKINQFQNRATYVNPSLAPELTEKLSQKIRSQTRLGITTSADDLSQQIWIIDCTITNYSISTAGISNQQVNANRLNVGVKVVVRDNRTQKEIGKYDITTPFEYGGSLSLQQAEQGLQTQILRDVTDAIFNRIFSNW